MKTRPYTWSDCFSAGRGGGCKVLSISAYICYQFELEASPPPHKGSLDGERPGGGQVDLGCVLHTNQETKSQNRCHVTYRFMSQNWGGGYVLSCQHRCCPWALGAVWLLLVSAYQHKALCFSGNYMAQQQIGATSLSLLKVTVIDKRVCLAITRWRRRNQTHPTSTLEQILP